MILRERHKKDRRYLSAVFFVYILDVKSPSNLFCWINLNTQCDVNISVPGSQQPFYLPTFAIGCRALFPSISRSGVIIGVCSRLLSRATFLTFGVM